MAKIIKKKFKVMARGGQATPGPPIGPTLGQHGVPINEFISRFNEETKSRMGEMVPAIITVYDDRSFDMTYKVAPASDLIKSALKLQSGSKTPATAKVGKITKAQLRELAQKKMTDMNTTDIEAAMRMLEGTARQMGVTVEK